MNPTKLAQDIEERYRRYLKTTFYFKDHILRASFEKALNSGHLRKGPYLEATPIFKKGQTPQNLFQRLLGFQPDQGFLKAVHGNRPLYHHQEEAIHQVFEGHNVVVATGTGSGKTEAFLYPILLHLYQEFQAGKLCSGVRALILYPMNALANDQRERLGEICKGFCEANSPFQFTFGQYIGETPEDESDSKRHARDHISKRLAGELVLRSEMRKTPPHILLTNYSMLEYLLLRPNDSPLFDNGQAKWWTFLVLDEAHQYRGSRGIEMAMLLRRLKQRLKEGGRLEPFQCIATSATLIDGVEDRAAVAGFASDLFGEEFREGNVILGKTEAIPEAGQENLNLDDYRLIKEVLSCKSPEAKNRLVELAIRLGVQFSDGEEISKIVGKILQSDSRSTTFRHLITANPEEVQKVADQIFSELTDKKRVSALSELVELLLQAKDPSSDAPLLSTRYHLFLRSLGGAFVSYWPEKKVFLDRQGNAGEAISFEVALCRECGQHYLVGNISKSNNKLVEAIRDPGHPDFGATFFRPMADEQINEEDNNSKGKFYRLCIRCGEIRRVREQLQCRHSETILVEKQAEAEEREDQIPKCSACGYQAPDPVREVVHGTDGPHAVIATTLYQSLPKERKKVLAFADGRQEAAFFAWYLEDSYKDILTRNLLMNVIQKLNSYTSEGLSLQEVSTELCNLFREKRILSSAVGDLELRRQSWLRIYREFLTDETRISLEGVGLVRWSVKWPEWIRTPEILGNTPWALTEEERWDLVSILLDSMRSDRAVELRAETGVSINWNDLGLQASQMRFRIGETGNQKNVRIWDGKEVDGLCFW